MQDRFKFRIFDKNQKKMVDLDAVGYSSFDPFGKGINRLIMIPSGLNNTFSYNKQALYENDNFTEPMQCTGLKDKNGKLIYEGDILRNTLTNKYASVAWHNTGAGYVWSKTIPNSYLYEFGVLFRVFGKYEVIGNIYENPELLEQL